jgi:hypothetical protein
MENEIIDDYEIIEEVPKTRPFVKFLKYTTITFASGYLCNSIHFKK